MARYDDLAGLSVPRLKTFVRRDYSGIKEKKQEENILSDGMQNLYRSGEALLYTIP